MRHFKDTIKFRPTIKSNIKSSRIWVPHGIQLSPFGLNCELNCLLDLIVNFIANSIVNLIANLIVNLIANLIVNLIANLINC